MVLTEINNNDKSIQCPNCSLFQLKNAWVINSGEKLLGYSCSNCGAQYIGSP